ncbi:putative low-complexity protein [Xenococcus sp. PCC 7305]|uniref:pentapeptide repeat-containing protein n=1 Tax=Xenococcus sp. PCC 7305 TaxID=102125 RepID=UPI0002ABC8B7|nr:pentapeptide repeat-containing protein [Xenococcus sp. PCC 7305]ELS04817.1 putative low-complexity protein [Xenococcus sp. PCC 7305]
MVICFPEQEFYQLPPNNLVVSQPKKPLGEILLEAGLVSIFQIEIALSEQQQSSYRIGEILAYHGWIKQETADFFAEKWINILEKTQTRPLAFYLYAAGLLDKEQLQSLKQQQRQNNSSAIRLHELAVEQGYLKQITIDFFLQYLFNIKTLNNLSFASPYKVIKSYINGETDFRGSKLSQVPLNGVRLKKVVLDESVLRQANLNNSNLTGSSLIAANLTLADLELANLSQVNLQQACLIEANLRNSNLDSVNFHAANLQEADLRGANLLNASFAAADLRGAKLSPKYSYDVFYDQQTIFDANFNPMKAGWKIQHFKKKLNCPKTGQGK